MKNTKTFLGIPLMRIFWLFIYSVVLCLLVGVGVWFFTNRSFQMVSGTEKTLTMGTSPKDSLHSDVNPYVKVLPITTSPTQEKITDLFLNKDFEGFFLYFHPKYFDCTVDIEKLVTSWDIYTYEKYCTGVEESLVPLFPVFIWGSEGTSFDYNGVVSLLSSQSTSGSPLLIYKDTINTQNSTNPRTIERYYFKMPNAVYIDDYFQSNVVAVDLELQEGFGGWVVNQVMLANLEELQNSGMDIK